MKKHTIAGLVLAGLAVAPLTGCGDGKDAPPPVGTPVASSPSTPKPSTSTSPTPPPEAMKNTKAGAEAFIRWYVVRRWDAATSRDPSLVIPYSDKRCTGCRDIIDNAKNSKESSKRPSGILSIKDVSAYQASDKQIWLANVSADLTHTAWIVNGKRNSQNDSNNRIMASIRFDGSRWTVASYKEIVK